MNRGETQRQADRHTPPARLFLTHSVSVITQSQSQRQRQMDTRSQIWGNHPILLAWRVPIMISVVRSRCMQTTRPPSQSSPAQSSLCACDGRSFNAMTGLQMVTYVLWCDGAVVQISGSLITDQSLSSSPRTYLGMYVFIRIILGALATATRAWPVQSPKNSPEMYWMLLLCIYQSIMALLSLSLSLCDR